jgi:heat shock protein HslJ
MKKKLFVCGLSALMLGAVSCKLQQKDTQKPDGTKSVSTADILDWNGFYTGVLPCADCSGIQMALRLFEDRTFKLKMTYLGKDDYSVDFSGEVIWDRDRGCITLAEVGDRFTVSENALIMLDREGNTITGDLAEHYILTGVDRKLVDRYWKLTELSGEPVVTPEGGKEAYLIFADESNRVTGNSGCNAFNGIYTLKPGNRIAFSQMVSTLMMCLNMDTETKMKQVLESAHSYAVTGNTFVLNRADMTPLACFKAVYKE